MPSIVAQSRELNLYPRDFPFHLLQDFRRDIKLVRGQENPLTRHDQINAPCLRDLSQNLSRCRFNLLHAFVEGFLQLTQPRVYEALRINRLLLKSRATLVQRFRRQDRGLLLQLLLSVSQIGLPLLNLRLVGVALPIDLLADAFGRGGFAQNDLKIHYTDNGRRQLLAGRQRGWQARRRRCLRGASGWGAGGRLLRGTRLLLLSKHRKRPKNEHSHEEQRDSAFKHHEIN